MPDGGQQHLRQRDSHAANAPPRADGASAAWVGAETAADILGMEPPVRTAGPGIGWDKAGAVELIEAPAAQSLMCVTAWRIDPGFINQHGGAILTGHPLGASGTRLLGTLARNLQASGQRWRVAAICNGVGQGPAVVAGNVSSAQRKQKGNRGDHANDRTLWGRGRGRHPG